MANFQHPHPKSGDGLLTPQCHVGTPKYADYPCNYVQTNPMMTVLKHYRQTQADGRDINSW